MKIDVLSVRISHAQGHEHRLESIVRRAVSLAAAGAGTRDDCDRVSLDRCADDDASHVVARPIARALKRAKRT